MVKPSAGFGAPNRMDTLSPQKSLVDQAYERILDAVCDGTFRPGERLTQEEIAARLNVSRQPITHALAMLKTQGFLTEAGRREWPRLVIEAFTDGDNESLATELRRPGLQLWTCLLYTSPSPRDS